MRAVPPACAAPPALSRGAMAFYAARRETEPPRSGSHLTLGLP